RRRRRRFGRIRAGRRLGKRGRPRGRGDHERRWGGDELPRRRNPARSPPAAKERAERNRHGTDRTRARAHARLSALEEAQRTLLRFAPALTARSSGAKASPIRTLPPIASSPPPITSESGRPQSPAPRRLRRTKRRPWPDTLAV